MVLDTNVLFQALSSNEGASYFILSLARSQKILMAVSTSTFSEYESVLKRKKSLERFGLNRKDIDSVLALIAYFARPIDPRYLFRPNLLDEDDNKFVELAVASGADYLITNNVRDFKNSQLRFEDLNVVTPGDFCKIWRSQNE